MASITYTNMISTTATTLAQYVYDGNNASLQALLEDTNFTCDGKYLMYKGVKIFNGVCGESAGTSNFLMYSSSVSSMAYGSNARTDFFGITTDTINIYDFTSFYLVLADITLDNFQTTSAGGKSMLIDKTNSEVFSGIDISYDTVAKGYSGIYFGYLNNSESVETAYVPTDYINVPGYWNDTSNAIKRATLREESASETTHIKLVGLDGRQATRTYFFKKFPRGCSNSVIQVDDKYFYMLPYPQVLPTLKSYDTSHTETTWEQEVYCTIGIDVTGEVS